MGSFKRVRPALGTFFEITINNLTNAEALIASSQAFIEVERLEKIFSCFDPFSEICGINQGPINTKIIMSSELTQVFKFGSELETFSSGSFKLQPECNHESCYRLEGNYVTRLSPCHFDLGGIAKGYIVDCIFEALRSIVPHANVLVNAGGDLRCHGAIEVQLKVPSISDEKNFALTNFKGALATSSLLGSHLNVGQASARYKKDLSFELLDKEHATVTVGASSCMVADALTKVLLFNKSKISLNKFPGTFSLRFNRLGCSL